MAGLSPIDFSLLAQQRSDVSKIAGDDFLKIQQQQLAAVMQDEQELKKEQASKVEEKGLVAIDSQNEESTGQEYSKENEEKKQKDIVNEEDYSYVEYDDPDLGKVGEWLG
ncbi:MAG: hypothetical protein PHF25_02980 [Candidatus Margulisbacteria bacterium]|nr:hypothetical protein [Candidatus Margulisiibacteriota bacterium]